MIKRPKRTLSTYSAVGKFPAFHLSTPSYRWLHEETWEKILYDFYIQNRLKVEKPIFKLSSPLVNRKSLGYVRTLGKWVLTQENFLPISFCEVQEIKSTFKKIILIFNPLDFLQHEQSEIKNFSPLSLIISALFIIGNFDICTFFIENKLSPLKLHALMEWSKDWKTVYGIDEAQTSLIDYKSISLSKSEWWQKTNAIKDKKTLSYLERRK